MRVLLSRRQRAQRTLIIERLNDALLGRILRMAESDLGTPPTPYAWLAFGSEGRMEQTLLTDQDNALVYGEDSPAARAYFARFAERAITDLQAAGFPRCPGGYMATRWQGPLDEWRDRFHGWLEKPTPTALLEASIFFDFRPVHGHLDVTALHALAAGAGGARSVRMTALSSRALDREGSSPPARSGLLRHRDRIRRGRCRSN